VASAEKIHIRIMKSMNQNITFNRKYFLLAVVLFIIEVLIALYVRDSFIRPYFGDFLVVILIYCFLKSFWNEKVLIVGMLTLLFSFAIEIGQYFNLVKLLGLEHSELARVVIGTGFAWGDMLAYTLGIVFVFVCEKFIFHKSLSKK